MRVIIIFICYAYYYIIIFICNAYYYYMLCAKHCSDWEYDTEQNQQKPSLLSYSILVSDDRKYKISKLYSLLVSGKCQREKKN